MVTTDFTPRSLRQLSHISQNGEIASRARFLEASRWDRLPDPPELTLDLSEYQDDEPDSIREPWPRCESGCLDLNSPQANELRDVLLSFSHCTEICIMDGGGKEMWSPPNRLPLNPVDIVCFMLSVLSQDGGLQVHRFDVQFDGGPPDKKTNRRPSTPELCHLLSQSTWTSHLRRLSIR